MARINQSVGNAQARAIINRLHSGGLSYSEIGKRLGRDSSYVSQIARGAPKGASLVSPLQRIEGGAKSVEVGRRVTKEGTAAKVRKAAINTVPGTERITIDTKTGNKTILSGLGKVSGKGQFLKWNIQFKKARKYTANGPVVRNVWVPGRLPRGMSTDDLIDRIKSPQAGDSWAPGDAMAALGAIALEQQSNTFYSADGPMNVHLYTQE